MKNKKIYFILSLFAVTLFSCSNNEKLHAELEKMAVNLNEAKHTQLDEHTVFMGAKVTDKNVFQYLYMIVNTNNPEAMMKEVETQTMHNIREAFKMNPDLKIFTVNKVSIDYIYTDTTGNVVGTIHITPDDYK